MQSMDLTCPPLPESFQIEVTGACNLRCRMCLVRYKPALSRAASMPFAEFRSLLDAMPQIRDLTLQGLGEPLMAPDLFAMIGYARERGIKVGFNSNATLLTARAGERLIDLGLDWLHVSLDGATEETYEFVRDQARWRTVHRNIDRFVRRLCERRSTRPELSLVMVLMRRNLQELPLIVEQAAAWGIREIWTQNLSHDFSDAPTAAYESIAAYVEDQSLSSLPVGEVERVFAEARRVASKEGVRLRLPAVEERQSREEVDGTAVGCAWPWRAAYVTYDGTVLPCCMVMGSGRAAMGSLKQASFAEIWEGKTFRDFRRGLIDGAPHPVCRGCSVYRGRF
jgi:radical SAM protein with 4Fe4S-binding SPASM domain